MVGHERHGNYDVGVRGVAEGAERLLLEILADSLQIDEGGDYKGPEEVCAPQRRSRHSAAP